MNPSMGRQADLDQRRAGHAWDVVQEVKAAPDGGDAAGQFDRAAKKLPARVMAAGLGQSLAFLLTRADKQPGVRKLLAALGDWVLVARPGGRAAPAAGPPDRRLLLAVIRGSATDLRRSTDEVLAYLRWLTRFAEAEGLSPEEGVQ